MPSRILFCTIAADGHVNPGLPIARELVARGHDVRWYTGQAHRGAIEATGARFEPFLEPHDPAHAPFQERFPQRAALEGLAGLKFDLKHLFLDEVPAQFRDLRRILATFEADIVVADTAFSAASLLHELGGPPFATYGISILPIPSADIPPIGTGRAPSSSPLVRWRDRILSSAVQKLMFRDVQRHYDRVRDQLGLAADGSTVFDTFVSPYLFVQASAPSFEYPRRDLPPQVHFVGPVLPEVPAGWQPPSWWPELDGPRPVVLVTQGTVATEPSELVLPALEGLAAEDVLVIVTGGVHSAELAAAAPPNTRVASFVPFGAVLDHVDVFVTNGGFGGVQFALGHGVPLVVAGTTEDKPEVAARAAWSGAGIRLATRAPSPEQVRDAVRRVLSDERHRRHARRIQADGARLGGAPAAAALIERLVTVRRPVTRELVRSGAQGAPEGPDALHLVR